ncbi:MAG: hypothetical protein H8Z69_04845 [Nanohaloarchaea archaeon]|nr:hypothetical protein [Candidatus Nanohaloarchaea archaeon]
MVEKEFEFSWSDLGQALGTPHPKKDVTDTDKEEYEELYEEFLEDKEAPDVVALHPSPSEEEDQIRYNFFEDHISAIDEVYEEWDPTLVVEEDISKRMEEEKGYGLEDLGFEVENYNIELDSFWDDYERIAENTHKDSTVQTVASDYCKKRSDWIGSKALDVEKHETLGPETDEIGRDSSKMRYKEMIKRRLEPLRYGLEKIKSIF